MKKVVKKYDSSEINPKWDLLAENYFQKKEFLAYLEKYNPVNQRYYELYDENIFLSGAVVYTFVADLLTFINKKSPIKMKIIGLPVSVSSSGTVGELEDVKFLIESILKEHEKGLILAMNFDELPKIEKTIPIRTLPTIILDKKINSWENYKKLLRSDYRRRLKKIEKRFEGVFQKTESCQAYTHEHHNLYLAIMKTTKTKLETLSYEFFKNLPPNFELTTYKSEDKILTWHINCLEDNMIFFFFGGINYELRDKYSAYYNNLFGILKSAYSKGYQKIDLGQTAETAKLKLGGHLSEKQMFLYHKNLLVRNLLKIFRKTISYNKFPESFNVFKT